MKFQGLPRATIIYCLSSIGLGLAGSAAGQAAPAPASQLPEFDAASVKPSALSVSAQWVSIFHGDIGMNGGARFDPQRMTVEGATVRYLIEQAYGILGYQLVGTPDWAGRDLFAVAATTAQPTTPDQMRLMLRRLLADRFRLVVAESSVAMPVYDLVVAPGGTTLKPLRADDACYPPGTSAPEVRKAMGAPPDSALSFRCTMDDLVKALNGRMPGDNLNRPVVDKTGLTGRYRIFVWQTMGAQGPDGSYNIADEEPLHEAVERELGLKLVEATERVRTINVVSVSRPTPN